ncbi:hypothetical protein [Massilia sp. ZL223]|uniref:hypothetical protein n=1 Tax=Massilia sp. ZL223 TaxID=2824904 RepID=UPI001B838C22|nr:hypothetical protein [Massilia sp. ZL223]MBQ5965446.1 hypothetical protein [Massilia sp. ZL223]
MFYSMGVQDYVSNEPAIKALVNEKNRLQQQLDNSSNPDVMKFVTVLCAFFNIIATVLVGIGINLVTSDSPPQHSGWILALGIAMTAFATITPIIAAFKKRKR